MPKNFGAERQRMRGLCLHATELIDELQRMYPQTMPDLSATDRELGAHVGTRQPPIDKRATSEHSHRAFFVCGAR